MWVVENKTLSQAHVGFNKLKILKSKAFKWNHDAKELKNFIRDVEQYFKAIGTYLQELKVTLATMYLVDDAKTMVT